MIINGECLEELQKLPDKSVDFFYLDLPWAETYVKWDKKIDLELLWKQLWRLSRHKRVAYVFSCSTKFGYSLIKSWEKGFKMDLIWKKRNKTGAAYCKYRPMKNHEMVYFFYHKAPKYNRNKYHFRIKKSNKKDGERKKYSRPTQNKSYTYNGKKFVKDDNFITGWREVDGKNFGRNSFEPPNPASIFESKKVFIGKRHHQAEKPLDLMEFLLKYWTDEGDVVLDPTMGSGTMGVMCKQMNRKFIGIERDPDIFKIAEKRIEEQKVFKEI